ncbi:MAG TPA: hypothetical protein VKA30_06725 [Actinomycetota bacterium]|nr:hypothetical protein [Actinomycetota bacterium]
MLRLRADPWAPDYGMGFEAAAQEEPELLPDPAVETADWSRPLAPPSVEPGPVWFVDGVRRVELRVVAENDVRRAHGLFGSYAVGSVYCDARASFGEHVVGRAVVLACGLRPEPVEARVGQMGIRFESHTTPGAEPNAPLQRLQDLMRDEERALAARLVLEGATLVLVDGPLRLGEEVGSPAVGVVKRSVRRYLDDEHEQLIGRLEAGQRTPVFGLLDREAGLRGYSWYARIASLREPWHDHAGVVRCEVRAGVGASAATALADRVTAILPAYAGRASDPRTPQNLAPVAALESWLRHRLGEPRLIRRALTGRLVEEAGVA